MHSTRKLFATTMIAAAGAVTAALAFSGTAAAQPASALPPDRPGLPGLPFIQQLASNPAAASQLMQGFTSLLNTAATPAAATPATPPQTATASVTLPQPPAALPGAAAPLNTPAAPATGPASLLPQAASIPSGLASLIPGGLPLAGLSARGDFGSRTCRNAATRRGSRGRCSRGRRSRGTSQRRYRADDDPAVGTALTAAATSTTKTTTRLTGGVMSTRTMFATAAVAIGSSVTLLFGGVTGVANAEPGPPAPPLPIDGLQAPGLTAVQGLGPVIQQAAADPTNAASTLMAAAAVFAGDAAAPADSRNVATAVNQFVAHTPAPGAVPGAEAHLPAGVNPANAVGPVPEAPAAPAPAPEAAPVPAPEAAPVPAPEAALLLLHRRRAPRRSPGSSAGSCRSRAGRRTRRPRIRTGCPGDAGLPVPVDQQRMPEGRRKRARHSDFSGRARQDPGARTRCRVRRPTSSPRSAPLAPPRSRSCRSTSPGST